jgi:hypothetical protein
LPVCRGKLKYFSGNFPILLGKSVKASLIVALSHLIGKISVC